MSVVVSDPFYHKYFKNKTTNKVKKELEITSVCFRIFDTFYFRKQIVMKRGRNSVSKYSSGPSSFNQIMNLYSFDYNISFDEFAEGVERLSRKLNNLFFSDSQVGYQGHYLNNYTNRLVDYLNNSNTRAFLVSDGDIFLPDSNIKINVSKKPERESIVNLAENGQVAVILSGTNDDRLMINVEKLAKSQELGTLFKEEKSGWLPLFFWLMYGDDKHKSLTEINKLLPDEDPEEIYYTHSLVEEYVGHSSIGSELWVISASKKGSYQRRISKSYYLDAGGRNFTYIKSKYGYFYSLDGKELHFSRDKKIIHKHIWPQSQTTEFDSKFKIVDTLSKLVIKVKEFFWQK